MSTLSRLLKESWTLVEDQGDKLASQFYARIFLTDPNLRDLFPVQMDLQRNRLLAAIVQAVQTVDDPDRFEAHLRSLGRDHRKYHVSPEHYSIVGAALIAAMRSFAGERWSIEYDQAWRDAYDAIAGTMLAGAEADSVNPAYWHAEVLTHERRGRDVAVLTCRPMHPFPFRAGQYVSVECQYQPRLWRTYSVANAPRGDGTLEFHIRAIGGGWVSSALVRRLQVGDMIRLGAPMGTMMLDPVSDRDMVCVAGGTGFAPIKALIEELTRYNRTRWVHLFLGAKDRDDLYDMPAVNRLASRYPWLSVVTACSDDPTYSGERGNVCDVAARYGPWPLHDFYVCGSPPMVRSSLRTLAGMGVPSIRVNYDAFADLPEVAADQRR